MSSASSTADRAPSASSAGGLRLLVGILLGLLVAIILMPVHMLIVSWGYHDGYYTDYPELVLVIAVVVSLLVRFGAGSRGLPVAVAAVAVTLFYLIGSEYFLARFLINKNLIDEGYEALPLLVSPLTALKMLSLYFSNDPFQLILWAIPVIGAFFFGLMTNLGGPRGYRLSGAAPIVMPQQKPQAAAQTADSLRMDDIPSAALAFGQPIQAYQTRTMSLLLMGGLLIIIGLGLGGLMLYTRGPFLLAAVFALPFIGPGIYRLALAVINISNQVLIFKDGLSVEQGGSTTVLRWTDISTVWMDQYRYRVNGIPVIDRHKYTLETRAGGRVVLDKTYKNIGDLGALIENTVAKNLFQAAVTALHRGESLVYGRFTLRKDALGIDNQSYPWQSAEVTLNSGFVRVHLPGKARMLDKLYSVSKIPNLTLFLTLVSMLASGKLPSPPPETVSQGG